MIQSEPKRESLFLKCWPALLIGGAWAWMFWPMMTGQQVVGFRDSAYLYYPLFKWIDAQWAAGEVPLWNPYCNYGIPVVADGSSSVFYPGKLVFFCRFLSYPARYGIYLAVHIPIAATGAYWFARTLKANQAGATLAAFSFAFGGSVLFQVTNVIFLVGAAWLPFALGCVWKLVKTGQSKWSVGAGTCCALMMLGGDPQMVYHVGLIALASTVAEFFRKRGRWFRTDHQVRSSPNVWLLGAVAKLFLMILVTGSLAAVQLLPTYFWAKHSERIQPDTAANIYQLIEAMPWVPLNNSKRVMSFAAREALGVSNEVECWEMLGDGDQHAFGLVAAPVGVVDHAYQFSQPPWTVSELFFPNISGKPFPINQRWTNGLPGAERVWVPSLYMGVIVLVLAVTGIRMWGRKQRNVWLTWVFLFFGIASFGWYGGIWLINEVFDSPQAIGSLGPQVGGVYWAMNMLLPKYFAFRYPAKLFLIASLAISILAGVSLRQVSLESWRRMTQIVFWMCVCGLSIWVSYFGREFFDIPTDPQFGPFDAIGAKRALWVALLQPFFVMATGWLSGLLIQRRRKILVNERRCFWIAIVLVTVVDVLIANHWLVPQVDATCFESQTNVHRQISELKQRSLDEGPCQIYRPMQTDLEPSQWQVQNSNDRLSEIVTWQRESLYPKHHLEDGVVLFGSFSSIWPLAYQQALNELLVVADQDSIPDANANARVDVARSSIGVIQNRNELEMELSVRLPSGDFLPPRPVFWLGQFRNNPNVMPSRYRAEDPGSAVFTSRISQFRSNRFVAQVSTDRPGAIGFMRIADTGWKATIKNLVTNETLAADVEADRQYEILFIELDQAGDYEIEFSYRPVEFWVGSWISGISWGLLFGWVLVRRSARPGNPWKRV